MSNTSNQPMWPMRKIFPLSAPWPGASVTPCCVAQVAEQRRSPSTPSGARTAVTTAEVSSSGENSSSPIALRPARVGAAEADVPLERGLEAVVEDHPERDVEARGSATRPA